MSNVDNHLRSWLLTKWLMKIRSTLLRHQLDSSCLERFSVAARPKQYFALHNNRSRPITWSRSSVTGIGTAFIPDNYPTVETRCGGIPRSEEMLGRGHFPLVIRVINGSPILPALRPFSLVHLPGNRPVPGLAMAGWRDALGDPSGELVANQNSESQTRSSPVRRPASVPKSSR